MSNTKASWRAGWESHGGQQPCYNRNQPQQPSHSILAFSKLRHTKPTTALCRAALPGVTEPKFHLHIPTALLDLFKFKLEIRNKGL